MATQPPARPGIPLRDRPTSAGASPVGRAHETVHIEVLVAGVARPGLLLQWRQTPSGWLGHTTYVVLDEPDPVIVTQWMPASHIRPAHPQN